eukprot:755789-Hanusia_phi.AAC.3
MLSFDSRNQTRQGFGLTSLALHKDSIYCTLESSSVVGKLGALLRGAARNSKGEMMEWREELDGKYVQREMNLRNELDGSFSAIAGDITVSSRSTTYLATSS